MRRHNYSEQRKTGDKRRYYDTVEKTENVKHGWYQPEIKDEESILPKSLHHGQVYT